MTTTLTWADLQDVGNAQAQLILQAIARHADWETGEAHPSRERIATMAKCSKRTVSRYLEKMEADGIIERIPQQRSNGSQTVNIYRLVGYADWFKSLREGGQVARPRVVDKYEEKDTPPGDSLTTPPCQQVTRPPCQQVSPPEELHLNNQGNKKRASAPATHGAARSALEVKPRLVKRGDTHWRLWLNWLTGQGHVDAAQHIEREGAMVVYAERPMTGVALPKLPPLDPAKLAKLEREREPVRVVRDPTGEAA